MKTKIFILALILSVSFIHLSCNKKQLSNRFLGYILNQKDSTPFANTQFKLWRKTGGFNPKVTETFFETDEGGYFDFTSAWGDDGAVAWPSFVDGAAYVGPPLLQLAPNSNGSWNSERTILITNFDTMYTTPYH